MKMNKQSQSAEHLKRGEDPFQNLENSKKTPQESVEALQDLLRVKNERMEAMQKTLPEDPVAHAQFDVTYKAVQARQALLETITV